ncbi:MAG: universal stress protein [Aquificae bacterium]|nr:universal stress protein [Aquificota bacterium]
MHVFENILVPVDFSQITDAVIKSAEFIAKNFDSTVHLLFVVEHLSPLVYVKNLEIFFEPDEEEILQLAEEKLKEEALENLKMYQKKLEEKGIKTKILIETGDIVDTILDFSEENNIDLIIIGSHKKGLVNKLILGTVSEKIISKASKSVLVIKGTPLSQINKILCGYDFLPNSKEALEIAKQLAKKFNAIIRIIHGDADEPFAHFKGIYKKVLERKKIILNQIQKQMEKENIVMDYEILREPPYEAIIDEIHIYQPDIVILGKRKTSVVKRLFIGTTASKVVKEANIPVIIVRRNYNEN